MCGGEGGCNKDEGGDKGGRGHKMLAMERVNVRWRRERGGQMLVVESLHVKRKMREGRRGGGRGGGRGGRREEKGRGRREGRKGGENKYIVFEERRKGRRGGGRGGKGGEEEEGEGRREGGSREGRGGGRGGREERTSTLYLLRKEGMMNRMGGGGQMLVVER